MDQIHWRPGGNEGAQRQKKQKILYDFLDESKMFRGTVVPEDRSLMNVPFVTDSDELNAKFIKEQLPLVLST